jgi:serine/threonine protein kinase
MVGRQPDNRNYNLAKAPFAKGGEGEVFAIHDTAFVAKCYFKPSGELEEKLLYMVNHRPKASILSSIAWPLDVIYDENHHFAGFVMERLSSTRDLQEVYAYPPQFSFKNRLIIAKNICTVISELHSAKYIFGDFNPNNIVVDGKTGEVTFIDTDSYHIVLDKTKNKAYRCKVDCPGYVAPELLQKIYHDSKSYTYENAPLDTFTQETDNFALAIHIFKLLMNGFTPFNGVDENNRSPRPSPGVGHDSVWQDSYCFKPGFKSMTPVVPPKNTIPPYIRSLFDKAFIAGRRDPGKRPSPDEWYTALGRYEGDLKPCGNPIHQYYRPLPRCPWCEAEERTKPPPPPPIIVDPPPPIIVVPPPPTRSVWARIGIIIIDIIIGAIGGLIDFILENGFIFIGIIIGAVIGGFSVGAGVGAGAGIGAVIGVIFGVGEGCAGFCYGAIIGAIIGTIFGVIFWAIFGSIDGTGGIIAGSVAGAVIFGSLGAIIKFFGR